MPSQFCIECALEQAPNEVRQIMRRELAFKGYYDLLCRNCMWSDTLVGKP